MHLHSHSHFLSLSFIQSSHEHPHNSTSQLTAQGTKREIYQCNWTVCVSLPLHLHVYVSLARGREEKFASSCSRRSKDTNRPANPSSPMVRSFRQSTDDMNHKTLSWTICPRRRRQKKVGTKYWQGSHTHTREAKRKRTGNPKGTSEENMTIKYKYL